MISQKSLFFHIKTIVESKKENLKTSKTLKLKTKTNKP